MTVTKTTNIHQIDGTEEQIKAINGLAQEFDVTTERLRVITDQFVKEMRRGLDHDGATGNLIIIKTKIKDLSFSSRFLLFLSSLKKGG